MTQIPDPDRLALDHAMVAEPVWNRLEKAGKAVGMGHDVLLHAGPPFQTTAEIPTPILNSAAAALEFEGITKDGTSGKALILNGEIRLEPAQDYNVTTPLAAVVSASMMLHSVYDAHRGRTVTYAPLNGGSGPAARLGQYSAAAVDHLSWLNETYCDVLVNGLAEGIPVLPIAAESMRNGDDCHGRTPHATRLLIGAIQERTEGGIRDERVLGFMDSSPSLFLNLWMAASKCALVQANGIIGSTVVTTAGGNGVEVGIQVACMPGKWITMAADAPVGDMEPGAPPGRALGAIGDSALIDAFGLGAMAFHQSPEQMKVMGQFLPEDIDCRRHQIMVGPHIGFRNDALMFGLSAARAAMCGMSPVISLGILDSAGELGRIGGGIYEMPHGIFVAALEGIDGE